MILVDTSVWIDLFRNAESPEGRYLSDAIDREDDIAFCGVIMTEVLQGIRSDEEYHSVRRNFISNLIFLPTEIRSYQLAASVYRNARSAGKTIRNTIDCLIASCAILHNVPLLQKDRDYRTIADFSTLELVEP